jgi:diguanylate cyclase (GGDEF)-like protein
MALSARLFGSRVERRVLFVFLLLTLLPATVLGVLAMREVERLALDQAQIDLRTTTKGYALDVLSRLNDLAAQLSLLVEHAGPPARWLPEVSQIDDFEAGPPIEATGARPTLSLIDGRLWIGMPSTAGGTLRFRINMDRILFDIEETHTASSRCVSFAEGPRWCSEAFPEAKNSLRAEWRLHLESTFQTDLVLQFRAHQEATAALGSVSLVGKILPLLIGVICLLITFVAIHTMRVRFRPLATLEAATHKVERGDYSLRINIQSGDEFESLGHAFNRMLERLQRSFLTLKSLADIDRMILSATKAEDIVLSVLKVANDGEATVSLLVWRSQPQPAYVHYEMVDGRMRARALADIQRHQGGLADIDELLGTLRDEAHLEFDHWLPLVMEKELGGLLLMQTGAKAVSADLLKMMSDLGDRLAVAFTNIERASTLYKQANFDPLTGLINRYAFEDALRHAVLQAERDETRGAVLFIDLDRFKHVNDTEGHKAGDRLLVQVAKRLTRCVRANDTLARLGGDEFAVVVHRFDQDAELIGMCERLVAAIGRPMVVDRIEHSVTASIGVALFPAPGHAIEQLLMRADTAMYRAKANGGSSFAFFDQALNDTTRERVLIESRLRRALRNGELDVHFQPKLHLSSWRVRSAEALLRWNDEELGSVSPAQFVPIAEETGLVRDFSELVARRAAAALHELAKQGIEFDHISINASGKELLAEGYARRLMDTIETTGLQLSQFEFEVTESVFIGDSAQVRSELAQLKLAGASIALDDFGTGYSSLNMLRSLPLDTLKIDRSFVVALSQSEEARSLARHIIEIARILNKAVVAEGPETDEEVALLASFGCDYVQGFAIARPMPLTELIDFVRDLEQRRHVRRAIAR